MTYNTQNLYFTLEGAYFILKSRGYFQARGVIPCYKSIAISKWMGNSEICLYLLNLHQERYWQIYHCFWVFNLPQRLCKTIFFTSKFAGWADPHSGADGQVCQHQRFARQRLWLKQVPDSDQVSNYFTGSNFVLAGGAGKGKKKKGKIVPDEYYESYYRNLAENTNLRDLKERSNILMVFCLKFRFWNLIFLLLRCCPT